VIDRPVLRYHEVIRNPNQIAPRPSHPLSERTPFPNAKNVTLLFDPQVSQHFCKKILSRKS
jgi:hypothetical protein